MALPQISSPSTETLTAAAARLPDVNVELSVPGVPRADTELTVREIWDAISKVGPKTLAGLLAAGALGYNAWLAGIFNSGHPLTEGSAQYFLVVLCQAIVVCYVVVVSSALAVDVAAGILTGAIVIIIGDVAGAFRGPFDVWQLVAQLVIGYAAVLALALGFAFFKARRNGSERPDPSAPLPPAPARSGGRTAGGSARRSAPPA